MYGGTYGGTYHGIYGEVQFCENFVSCGVKGDRQFDWLIACETEYKRALHGTYDGMDI